MRRVIGPSITQGAISPFQRRHAMKVWVSQCPNGAFAYRRWPLGERPRDRVILVDVPVSSRKTSRCGSCCMSGWRLVCQCSRAWRTSERPCSLARSVFFEAVALADEPARDRGGRDLGSKGGQFSRELRHGEVALLSHAADQKLPMRIELGVAPTALWLGGQAAGGPIGRHQPDH